MALQWRSQPEVDVPLRVNGTELKFSIPRTQPQAAASAHYQKTNQKNTKHETEPTTPALSGRKKTGAESVMKMKTIKLAAASGTQIAALPLSSRAYAFQSSDKWATWTSGSYIVANDVWGSNPGPETIWANSGSNWGVITTQYGPGIQSYPHVEYNSINSAVNSLGTITSSFNDHSGRLQLRYVLRYSAQRLRLRSHDLDIGAATSPLPNRTMPRARPIPPIPT